MIDLISGNLLNV